MDKEYEVAAPRYLARELTADNAVELAEWLGLPELPERQLAFHEAAEPGDIIVRSADLAVEQSGGWVYTASEFAERYREAWVPPSASR